MTKKNDQLLTIQLYTNNKFARDSAANRPYRLFTFDPMASFPCLSVLARQACA